MKKKRILNNNKNLKFQKYSFYINIFIIYLKNRNCYDFRYKNIILIITPILIRILKNKLNFYDIYIIRSHNFKFYKIILLNEENARLRTDEFYMYL